MKIDCTHCGSEVNLDHEVFNDYQGPVKCFCCGTTMDIRISDGILESASSHVLPSEPPIDLLAERARDLEPGGTSPKDNAL
jgi:hypothetical protein